MSTTIAPSKRFPLEAVSVWAMVLSVPLAAVFFIPSETIPMISTKVALLVYGTLVAFIFFALSRLFKGSLALPPLFLIGTLWLIPIAYVLSTLFSGVPFATALFGVELETDTLGFMLLLASITTVAALTLRTETHYKRFFFVGGIALGLIVLAQVVFVALAKVFPDLSAANNLVGAYADMSMVVGAGLVLVLLALRMMRFSNSMRVALFAVVAIGLLILIVANLTVVWALIALFAGALFVESVTTHRTPDPSVQTVPAHKSKHHFVVSLLCLIVAVFFLFFGANQNTGEGIANNVAVAFGINIIDVRPSWQSTIMVGSHTLAASPLFGSGPTTFSQEWLQFKDRALNDTVFWNVDFNAGIGHIPTSFITTGVIGALAWLFFLGVFLIIGIRTLLFRLPEGRLFRYTSIGSYLGALYVFALAFLATPGPMVLALGFVLLGIFVSTLRYAKGRDEHLITFSQSPRLGFVLVFVLTLLLLGALAVAYIVTERYISNVRFVEANAALVSENYELAQAKNTQSLALAPSERAHRLASVIGIQQMRLIANATDLPQAQAQEQFQAALSRSLESALAATRLGPEDYQNWTALGNVYQSVASLDIEGAYQGAKDSYEKAMALNPTSPVLPYVLAQLELNQDNLEAAETHALASVNLKRDYIPAILFLAQLEIRLGKAAEALQAAEAAAYFAPNDPAVLLQVGLLRSGTGDIAGSITALSRAIELNPQYANARFFLAAMYARQGNYEAAVAELRTIASFSPENAESVAADLKALEEGKNPYTQARLRSLGVPQPPVSEPQDTTVE